LPPKENASCAKCSLPANIDFYLYKSEVEFLAKYNPSTAGHLLEQGYTPGKVAQLPDVPCLCDVATKWGKDIAVSWIEILLTNIEEKLGNSAIFSAEAKKDAASTLFSYYRDMNLAEFLLFLAWYKLGKFKDIYSSGLEKVMYALSIYRQQRDYELTRLEIEAEYQKAEAERKARAGKCISYEEYLKTKEL
jgi:hypothetical protein